MINNKKIFVFDFDGVICDSTNECLINSYNSYNIYLNNSRKFITSLIEIDANLKKDFRVIRPYIKGAKEYLKFYDYYYSCKKILSLNDFIEYENNALDYDQYTKIFYQQREHLKKNNLKEWFSYNHVFQELINFLNSLDYYYIATLKDKDSVIDILKFYKIKIYEEKILDFNIIKSKLDALNMILNNNSYNKEDIIFIDDNAYHLIDPKNQEFRVYLSNWADLDNDKHIQIAKDNFIDILDRIDILT